MKRAGAKNDGAWFRANKTIRKFTTADFARFKGYLYDMCSTEAEAAFAKLQELALKTGNNDLLPETATMWFSEMLEGAASGKGGIPRSVWIGHLPFTTYDKVADETNGGFKYVPVGQVEFQALGKVVRKYTRDFIWGMRELKDMLNTDLAVHGNPGGVANALKGE